MAQSLSSEELVHEAACGMIREFLKRKNLSAVAEIFDSEQPRTASSFKSKKEIIKAVRMEKIVKDQKQKGDAKKPLIEMMASHFYADSLGLSKGNRDKTNKKKSRSQKKSAKDHSKSTQDTREEAPDEETAPAFDTATASPAGADSTAKAEADSTEKAEPETFKFQCPDGRGFNDREAYKVHMVEKILKFDKLTQRKDLRRPPGWIQGQAFTMTNLTHCEVQLMDHSDTVIVQDLSDCKVLIGASNNSVFLRNCKNCTFVVACKQLRTRNCYDTDVFLYTLTDPVIEMSDHIRVGPFIGAYPHLDQHFKEAGLNPNDNHWRNVYDFTEDETSLRKWDSTGKHWCPIADEEAKAAAKDWTFELPDTDASPVNPVPFGATSAAQVETEAQVGIAIQSFSFKTSQEEAEKAVDALNEVAKKKRKDKKRKKKSRSERKDKDGDGSKHRHKHKHKHKHKRKAAAASAAAAAEVPLESDGAAAASPPVPTPSALLRPKLGVLGAPLRAQPGSLGSLRGGKLGRETSSARPDISDILKAQKGEDFEEFERELGLEYNSDDDDFGLGAAEKNMNFRDDMDKESEDKLHKQAQQRAQNRQQERERESQERERRQRQQRAFNDDLRGAFSR